MEYYGSVGQQQQERAGEKSKFAQMENRAKGSDQVYVTSRSREVPRHEMEYTDAASAVCSPIAEAAGWGVEPAAHGQVAPEEQVPDIDIGARPAENSEEQLKYMY